MKTLRNSIISYFLVAGILYWLAIPFIMDPVLRAATVLMLAFMPLSSFRLYAEARKVQTARTQLKGFLEQLCIMISTGKSLETGIIDSGKELLPVYGEKSILCKAVKVFKDLTATGCPLDDAILAMARIIPCPEACPLFHAISGSRHLGNRILQVLRQSLSMVSDLLAVTKDISTDVSQKRLESAIMSVMPFGVLWSLHLGTPSYLDPAFSKPLGKMLMLLAFVLSITGYCLAGVIVSRSIYHKSKTGFDSSGSSLSVALAGLFSHLIGPYPIRVALLTRSARLLPEGYRLSMMRTLSYLYPQKADVFEEHLFIKGGLLLFCLAVSLVFRIFIPVPFMLSLLLSCLILFLHDLDTQKRIERNKTQMMQDFPTFVGLVSTLLCNGIVLSKALLLSMDTFRNASLPFRNELGLLRGSLAAGLPCHEALERFGFRCQIPEIACALHFAAQYDKTGGQENLNFLKLQCSTCWIQTKLSARKQLEESSVKLLFPMMMQLVCVLLITVTPAVLSLQPIA